MSFLLNMTCCYVWFVSFFVITASTLYCPHWKILHSFVWIFPFFQHLMWQLPSLLFYYQVKEKLSFLIFLCRLAVYAEKLWPGAIKAPACSQRITRGWFRGMNLFVGLRAKCMVFNTFLFVFATRTVGDTQMHLCHVVSTFFLFTAFLLLSAKKESTNNASQR